MYKRQFLSCKKEQLITNSSAILTFSSPDVSFDTVFTTIGSATRYFKVYNKNSQAIKITSLKLGGGINSNFRINVDGVATITSNAIEIAANDSVYVFVAVTVNPTNSNSPLVIMDSIIFETNGNLQKVYLEAWGQDAYYHKPSEFQGISFIKQNDVWLNDKPHIIYDYAIVDSASTLTILPGTRIYMHKSAVLWISKDATLSIQGNHNSPVVIEGDRREITFQNIPGQWGRIWLSAGSINNTINWAIIKNGNIGVHLDTLGNSTNPTLTIENTIIKNMLAAAIFAQGSSIAAANCVFANCGEYVAALTLGGNYNFTHCTFANYWENSNRQKPTLFINNWYKDISNIIRPRDLDNAYFANCIIYGSEINEVGFDSLSIGGKFNYKFQNCLLKITNTENTSNAYHYNTIYKNQDPLFKDTRINDYNLLPLSPSINKGDVAIGKKYPIDLNNKSRINDIAPDLGAYEQ